MIEEEVLAGGPEQLPAWIEIALWGSVALAAVWLLLTIFVHMRRSASNLTPVNAPTAKKSATPDFMKVDEKAREAQIKRGETYEKELDKREAEEAKASDAVKQATFLQRLAGLATLLVSLFSLASTAIGVIWQVDRIGGALSQADKLGLIIQNYPIPFAVCTFVIGYYVVMFFVQKQWKRADR
jgi:hypothetical protein